MTKATIWRTAFLAVTGLAIVLEVWASFDGDPRTDPWTDLIVRHIPGEITALLIAGLAGWLGVHFGLRYWRKHKTDEANRGDTPTVEGKDTDEPQD